jgi:hypothetical protein
MKKDIKDYLHFYPGVTLRSKTGFVTLLGVLHYDPIKVVVENGSEVYKTELGEYLPELRSLSDMTEEEAMACYKLNPYSKGEWLIEKVTVKENIKGFEPNIVEIKWSGKDGTGYSAGVDYMYFNKLNAEQHHYLLSKHFDLFGLIESNLALDKTKLQTEVK